MELLLLQRETESDEWTQGVLAINGVMECYTLEDQYSPVKVMHETRIPPGRYEIKLRTFGGHHERYKKKFDFHRGMLWLQNVPNFHDILIHIGNQDDDSSGCILVGEKYHEGKLINSTAAYEKMYKKILREGFDKSGVEPIFITVKDHA